MKAATSEARRPNTIEDWCFLVPHLLSREGWQTLVQKPSSALLQSRGPWGDTLIKCLLHDVVILNPPEDPAYLLVRPETRAWSCECHPDPTGVEEVREVRELHAPGTCLENFWVDWPWIRLCDTLFGILHSQRLPGKLCFGHSALPVTTIERVRRNFPEKGDCSLTWRDLGDQSQDQASACVLLCRRQENGHYTVHFVMGTSEHLQMPSRAADAIRLVLDALRCEAIRYLNRPQTTLEWQRDRTLYMVLSITSFGLRLPVIPSLDAETSETGQLTNIKAGQEVGLSTWVPYDPVMVGSGAFHLSEYLRLFFRRTGVNVRTYQFLDGQKLLPYQCVVQREEWNVARDRFKSVYALQKTAYRRANGGTAVPRIVEESTPRFCREVVGSFLNQVGSQSDLCKPGPELVHESFLEIPDGTGFGRGFADETRCRALSPVR
ncbi:MGLL [Symbiodinium microadriaticum]|nr:MGLL [Symbiodinium microadriaticum]